jgi:hypothetical protein
VDRKRFCFQVEAFSFFVSLLIHSIILLTLALCVSSHNDTKKIELVLNINEIEETIDDSALTILECVSVGDINPDVHDVTLDRGEDIVSINENDFFDLLKIDKVLDSSKVETSSIPAGLSSKSKSKGNGGKQDTTEFKKRLAKHKGKSGDIQISLLWDNINDIDLHVSFYGNGIKSQIDWTNKFGYSGGILDIDMNSVSSATSKNPIENIYWPKNRAPKGTYIVYVHYFKCYDYRSLKTPVKIMVKNDNETKIINTVVEFGNQPIEIARFEKN